MTPAPVEGGQLVLRGDRMDEVYVLALLCALAGLASWTAWIVGAGALAGAAVALLAVAGVLASRLGRNLVTLEVEGGALHVTAGGRFGLRPRRSVLPVALVTRVSVVPGGRWHWLRAALTALSDRNVGLCLDLSNGRRVLLARYMSEARPEFRRARAALERFLWPDAGGGNSNAT